MIMNHDTPYIHTETYAQELEAEVTAWYEQHHEEEVYYCELIHRLITSSSPESRTELMQLFQDPDFNDTYQGRSSFAYMFILMRIYELELAAKEKITVLDLSKDRASLEQIVQKLKFLLWRIEFAHDDTAPDMLLDYVTGTTLSPCMVGYLVSINSYDKKFMYTTLANLFLKANMIRYSFYMLNSYNTLYPGEEQILCLLAELSFCTGNRSRAMEYLHQIVTPGTMTKEVMKRYECE